MNNEEKLLKEVEQLQTALNLMDKRLGAVEDAVSRLREYHLRDSERTTKLETNYFSIDYNLTDSMGTIKLLQYQIKMLEERIAKLKAAADGK